ncbi:MAG: hypothetical protein NT161_02175, partial [Candidatus Nomurabacteria bacterium]|nr:hypothetical protein [Candidatus Nomurabacteria bacterium]
DLDVCSSDLGTVDVSLSPPRGTSLTYFISNTSGCLGATGGYSQNDGCYAWIGNGGVQSFIFPAPSLGSLKLTADPNTITPYHWGQGFTISAASNTPPGTYSATVWYNAGRFGAGGQVPNANNCCDSGSVSFNITVPAPPPLSVTQSGLVWSTSAKPTTANSRTRDGLTTNGSFVSNMTGLTPNTIYYVRAYAIDNLSATHYGDDVTFTTAPLPAPTLSLTANTLSPSSISVGSSGTSTITVTSSNINASGISLTTNANGTGLQLGLIPSVVSGNGSLTSTLTVGVGTATSASCPAASPCIVTVTGSGTGTNTNPTPPASVNVPVTVAAPMSGSLSVPSCVIPSGGSSCTSTASWSIENPQAPTTAITWSGGLVNVSNSLTPSSQRGTASVTVPYPSRTFYLYNNGVEPPLSQSTAYASCASPTVWNTTSGTCARIIIPPVTTPAPISATAVSSSQINVSWGASTGGDGSRIAYNIHRCAGAGCTANQYIDWGYPTSYSDTGQWNQTPLSCNTTYGYRVRAYDGRGSASLSGFSSSAYATTAACSPPVDGYWGAWSGCSASCDGGTQTRSCIGPSNGGAPCSGVSSQSCNTQACPPIECSPPLSKTVTVACDPIADYSVTGSVTRSQEKSVYPGCTFPSAPVTVSNSSYVSDTCVYTANPTMSGTLSGSNCTIASGANSCSTTLSWSTTNPVGTSAVTSSYPVANTTVVSGNSGSQSVLIPYSSRDFYLYNNTKSLVPTSPNGAGVVITASCISGTTWSSGQNKCIVAVPPTPTASISASPSSVASGGAVTITWSSSNATTCAGTGFNTGGATSSPPGGVTVFPTSNTTYGLSCDNGTVVVNSSTSVTISSAGTKKKPIIIEN